MPLKPRAEQGSEEAESGVLQLGSNEEAAEEQSCAPAQHPLSLPVQRTTHAGMGVRPGWGWLLLPVCQALVVPREVSGQEGRTLSLRCWYARGYEGYNKYWCRGAARGSCHKVVETAGREVPRRHGRISITDNHMFCVVLLTVEELSREDAGSYWCGVEKAGWDIMEPVTLRVTPAPSPVPSNTITEFPYTANVTATGAGLQEESTSLQEGQEQPSSSPPSPSGPALQALLPTVLLLFLLAVAGSAGLTLALRRRRRRRKEALQIPLGAVGSSQPCSPAVQAQRHHQVRAPVLGQAAGDALPPRSKGPAAPSQPGTTAELNNIYDNELNLRKGTRTGSSDTEEQCSELGDDTVYINS
ncbi:LOW QUALITY PROTEIN: CMRF35-like molecule 8 [Numida meleagris]|uniref:LOW QUALITY PROTEIN: CMRF35-like molecule 8 n=1 Tax=Numida meleagris TaxID=8996 RepID=UPI000B3E2D08|nr:LOW QUALITY PROTEIN: CMRF35-like molecule 8 [Numida meleagris]